ncbi:hypothetical protein KP509_37G015000 [Ceratopteris richardii]|uniref:Secreted protein n=1 Tax=Ceratopteris richardii TaxID=49495 RepID=A0A8T2Q6Y7_CERRI|nr:hypothetical protein KP509_37G015000 [Ceratopteris richardii]
MPGVEILVFGALCLVELSFNNASTDGFASHTTPLTITCYLPTIISDTLICQSFSPYFQRVLKAIQR